MKHHHLSDDQTFFSEKRLDFPQLSRGQNEPPFIFLDNAASTLKPRSMIDCLNQFYSKEYATVHRSIYQSAKKATERFQAVRTLIQTFLHAPSDEEIIFTHNATDSLNIAAELLSTLLTSKSKIILSEMEHHSNIVPWQIAAERTGAQIIVIPLIDHSTLDLEFLEKELKGGNVTVVSLCHASNILGTINPIRTIADMCHRFGALLVVDAAQSVSHMECDIQALGCDFFAFSAHKMYGPTGVGVLWGKKELLEALKPLRGGGGMIETVTFAKTSYGALPVRFESGTPAVAEVIAFGESLSYLQNIGMKRIHDWEQNLVTYLRDKLSTFQDIQLYGPCGERSSLQSLFIHKTHPYDIASLLDTRGIAVRSGHMCGQPLLASLRVPSVLRISFGLYNTIEECDIFLNALDDVVKRLK